jgi:hypothetical protein
VPVFVSEREIYYAFDLVSLISFGRLVQKSAAASRLFHPLMLDLKGSSKHSASSQIVKLRHILSGRLTPGQD